MSGLDDPTVDARMRAATVWIARTCVEVERGLRDERQLAGLLPATVRHTVADRFRLAPTPGLGPVTSEDLGRVTLSRPVASHLYATISTRAADDRWSALSIHYLTVNGRIHVADVHRPERTRHHPAVAAGRSRSPDGPWHELDRATDLRALVRAATATTTDRLETMTGDDPLRPHVEQLAASLTSIRRQLDRQVLDAARATELRASLIQHRGRS